MTSKFAEFVKTLSSSIYVEVSDGSICVPFDLCTDEIVARARALGVIVDVSDKGMIFE